MTTKEEQIKMDKTLVAPEKRFKFGRCNMRINQDFKPKEPMYQVILDCLALTTCYPAFLITADVPEIYMHQFWNTINKQENSYRFKINKKRVSVNVEVFREILDICPHVEGQAFEAPPTEEDILSFVRDLGHNGEITCITDIIIDNKDSKKSDKMLYLRFTKAIIQHFIKKDKSIPMRNRWFMHTSQDDYLLGTLKFISRHEDAQVFGAILPDEMTNQAIRESDAYKSYYEVASGAVPPKSKRQKKSESVFEEPTPEKKQAKPKKAVAEPRPSKKKSTTRTDKGKGLSVLSKAALSEEEQLRKAIKQSRKEAQAFQAGRSAAKEEVDDDEALSDSDDDNDDDKAGSDDERTKSDSDEGDEEKLEEEEVHSEEDKREEEEVHSEEERREEDEDYYEGGEYAEDEYHEEEEESKELYANLNLRKEEASQGTGVEYMEEDSHMTLTKVQDTQKIDEPKHSSSVSSDFHKKMLNLDQKPPEEGEVASLLATSTVAPPLLPITPTPLLATILPTPTPTTSATTTPATTIDPFPSFGLVFMFEDRVKSLEVQMSELKQTNPFATALSSIPGIVDKYIASQLKDEVNTVVHIQSNKIREAAAAVNQDFINRADQAMKEIIKDQVS
ncbi:zinc finger, CCHC-type containing protein [Tanacetum coccineum]